MIIDKNKKFIFIHNPRTGGTAVSKSLINARDQADEKEFGDYVRQSRFFNVDVRPRRAQYQAGAHPLDRERLVSGLSVNTDFNVLETVYSDVPNLVFSHHEHLSLYSCTSQHLLNEYKYKFVCVRNPWSRLLSYYIKVKKTFHEYSETNNAPISPHLPFTFDFFINEIMRNRFDNNLNYLYEVPQTYWTYGADEIIRYDELNKKWEDILQSCGINYRPLLKPSNKTNISERKKCSDYYENGDHLIEKVADCFAEEIALFNFDYNGEL